MVERRLLIGDDERMILDTIFRQHGYRMVVVAALAEAIQAINREPFNVLLADLNIDKPGTEHPPSARCVSRIRGPNT